MTIAELKHVLGEMNSVSYADAIWASHTGLVLHQAVYDAVYAGALKESEVPGQRITPPCPKKTEN
jgi:hypothetical protein